MIVDTALSMLGFIVIGNLLFIIPLSNYIIYGVLISLISVFFIIYKINFYEQYLTYIDIGHYISIISLIVISIGTREDYTKHIEKSGNLSKLESFKFFRLFSFSEPYFSKLLSYICRYFFYCLKNDAMVYFFQF